MKIICVCGARPNFMKIAPLVNELNKQKGFKVILVHTGQHYDEKMSSLFFGQLGIPEPDLNLEVGSASHSFQTAEVMKRFEPICLKEKPDWIFVVGDVNSTLACSLVASKLGIRIDHVEAGLRSFDRTMPEEINRILTDALSDLLFVTESSGLKNLHNEGISTEKIFLVGNVMIDTLLRNRSEADKSKILTILGIEKKNYAVVTLHRPSNVDDKKDFSSILKALKVISIDMKIFFPVHPRTLKNIESMELNEKVKEIPSLHLVEPLGYLDFLKLMSDAAVVLTDSGGIQEETTILGVPCLTLRENTERPITLTQGTNHLTGNKTSSILAAYRDIRGNPPKKVKRPPFWDGKAAKRIVKIMMKQG